MLGNEAKLVREKYKPTMVLCLETLSDNNIQHTILHEFGHALGLGHEHQHTDYINSMKTLLNENKVMACYGIKSRDFFHKQHGDLSTKGVIQSKFDDKSIMHYP